MHIHEKELEDKENVKVYWDEPPEIVMTWPRRVLA